MHVQWFPRLFTEPVDSPMRHMRLGPRGFMVAPRGVKAPGASGGLRRSHSSWVTKRRMALTGIRIIGRGAT